MLSNTGYAYTQNVAGTRSYAVNALNQYTGVNGNSYSYDLDGNLTGDGGWTWTYDADNRMTSIAGSDSPTVTLQFMPCDFALPDRTERRKSSVLGPAYGLRAMLF